ncbi:MAG: hypothetical protein HQ519_01825 [Planctomycetes bacterium]|nr:hypothetical protein [Planctomycetota bacterium]
MKHTLFLVHGMGFHTPNWADEIESKLAEVAKRYPYFQSHALEDFVQFEPIHYDDQFQQITQQWQDSAGGVSAFASEQDLDFGGSLSWLDEIAGKDAHFFWTHVADALIYRIFKLYRMGIRAHVMDQFASRLSARFELDGGVEASVLAHSLGTAVTHDTLHAMGTSRPGGLVNALAHPNWGFRAIFMVANVSRMLQSEYKAYESIVRPGPRNSPKSYCNRFYNFHHELDPFTLPKPFEPDDFGTLYTDKKLSHYRDWNTHDFATYLDNPRVHIPILNTIRPASISRNQHRAALAAYPQFGGQFSAVPAVKEKLGELAALGQGLPEKPELKDYFSFTLTGISILGEIKELIQQQGAE